VADDPDVRLSRRFHGVPAAFERWVAATEGRDIRQLIGDSLAELKAVTAAT
jgi:hypothetical protein